MRKKKSTTGTPNKPRPIKAYAVVDRKKPKFRVLDIFTIQDGREVKYDKSEALCIVEINFIKFIKK